jgi:hypothetical protein
MVVSAQVANPTGVSGQTLAAVLRFDPTSIRSVWKTHVFRYPAAYRSLHATTRTRGFIEFEKSMFLPLIFLPPS